MTVFGWLTIALWVAAAVNSPQNNARILCIVMIIGTLVWGTGSL